eukprot:1882706-Amphidinium_carterae.3
MTELDLLVKLGYLRSFSDGLSDLEQCKEFVQGEPVLSKLGLISKEVVLVNGQVKTKGRLILDCRRSMVNDAAHQNHRIVLPSARDVVQDILALSDACKRNEGVQMLVLDVKDAFFKLPLTWVERKYAVARISSGRGYSYLVDTRPPQAAKNAPQVWGRLAALTGRLRGTQLEIKLNFAIFITALRSLGFDLVFYKAQMGSVVIWIGACITTRRDEIIAGGS